MKLLFIKSLVLMLTLIAFLVLYIVYLQYQGSLISKGTPIADYDNPRAILFVIDIQEGTTGSISIENTYKNQSNVLIQTINELIQWADTCGIPVVYIKQQTENILLNFASNNVLAKDYPGSRIDKRVKIVSKNIFTKTLMDAFSNEKLEDFLISESVNKIYLTGLDVAYCVNRTAFAAKNREYDVIIIEDALISEDDKLKSEMIENFHDEGMTIIQSSDLLNSTR